MPPRKKAAATSVDGADAPDAKPQAAAMRASTRARAPSAKATAVAAAAAGNGASNSKGTKAKTPTTAAGKGKGKRVREESDGEDEVGEEEDEGKKAKGKAKAAKGRGRKKSMEVVDEEDELEEEEEEEDRKPPAKKARTTKAAPKVTATKTKTKAKAKAGADGDVDIDADGASADKDADDDDDDEDKNKADKKPASKKPASKKPASKAVKDVADLPQKMVTVLKRGAAPVDACSGMVNTHQVLVTDDGVWDAMLNQTDLGKNANKFYVLQLLHPIGNNSSCTLYTRWGRVGENGQSQKKGPFSPAMAVNEFKKQFKAKASVNWENRVGMVARKGKYTWLERSYGDEDEDDSQAKASGSSNKKKDEEEVEIPDSTLALEVQVLCRLLFSTIFLDAHLSSMNYDANKLPLGKLAKSTILSGFAALKTLSEVIAQPNCDAATLLGGFRQAVEELTGRYYSIIPHVFGRDRPIVIDNLDRLKRELELVDALGDMEVASKLISSGAGIAKDEHGNPLNPVDANFRSLELSKMEPIWRSGREWAALEKYTQETHGATHSHYRVEVLHAYRVEREYETKAWNDAGFHNLADGERLLLWHGSRTTNFAGILKQGLRIAPPEAPVTGYMFGKGVYFADMMSKSANYCHAYLSDDVGLLLLCEVAAKPFYEQYQANYNADQDCKKADAKATLGLGRTRPAEWQDAGEALDNPELRGCHMPKGPGKDVSDPKAYLQYNEYIVYDASQIRLRYLLMVKMR